MDNNLSIEGSDFGELLTKYSHFFGEIRKRLIFTLCFFVAGSSIGFLFYGKIILFIVDIFSLRGINIVSTSPFQFLNLSVSCGIATGIIFVFPLLLYQALAFLKPALKSHEFKAVLWLLPFSIMLFLGGFGFGVYIMKWQIQVFLSQSVELGIGNVLDIGSLMSMVLLISSLMGLAFQSPILLLLLMKIGVVSRETLAKWRMWVYVGAVIFVVILPVDSIVADILLTLPLLGLFELTLIIDRFFGRPKSSKVAGSSE